MAHETKILKLMVFIIFLVAPPLIQEGWVSNTYGKSAPREAAGVEDRVFVSELDADQENREDEECAFSEEMECVQGYKKEIELYAHSCAQKITKDFPSPISLPIAALNLKQITIAAGNGVTIPLIERRGRIEGVYWGSSTNFSDALEFIQFLEQGRIISVLVNQQREDRWKLENNFPLFAPQPDVEKDPGWEQTFRNYIKKLKDCSDTNFHNLCTWCPINKLQMVQP